MMQNTFTLFNENYYFIWEEKGKRRNLLKTKSNQLTREYYLDIFLKYSFSFFLFKIAKKKMNSNEEADQF